MKRYCVALFIGYILMNSTVLALEQESEATVLNSKNEARQVLIAPPSNEMRVNSQDFDKRYIELLEKVNQQTSLLWTPYNTFIAALGVLIALGAIISVYFIYRQGKDYKDQRNSEINAFFKRQEKLNEETRLKLSQKSRELEEQVKSTLQEAQKAEQSSDEPKYVELKEKIERLMKQREVVQSQVSNLSGAVMVEYDSPKSLSLGMSSTPSWIRCSQCKFGYRLMGVQTQFAYATNPFERGNAQCPKCGNIDQV